MKILFLQTNFNSSNSFVFSFGINSMAAVLRSHGHKCTYYLASASVESEIVTLKKKIDDFNPDVIGFTAITSQFEYVKRLAGQIKKFFSGIVICGGVHPTLEPDCLEESPQLDSICTGEGEYALLDLLNALSNGTDIYSTSGFWFKRNGRIIRNGAKPLIQDLDKLPFPDTDICDWQKLIDETNGRLRILFSRGCPFKCTYCSNHALNKLNKGSNVVRYPSIKRCMDEIEFVTSKYRFDHLYFADDTFILNKKWCAEFLKEYQQKFNFPFGCQIRANLCSKETFSSLRQAGCFAVMMGVESGNDYVRNEVLKRNMKKEQIVAAFSGARDVGIKTAAQVMIGLPFETEETVLDTINLMAELNPDEVRHGVFFPYPNTELQNVCYKHGFLKKEAYGGDYCERADSILELPGISKERIKYINDNFVNLVNEAILRRGETPRGGEVSTRTGFVSSLTS